MSIFLGSAAPTTYKLGATAVSKLYLGATQVWTAEPVVTPSGYAVSGSDDYAGNYTISGTSTSGYPAWQHTSKTYFLEYNGETSGWMLFPGTIADGYFSGPIAFQSCGFPAGGSGTCTQETVTGDYGVSTPEGPFVLFTVTAISPPPPASLLTMTRSNNGGVIVGWDGDGTTGTPFFFGAPASSFGEGVYIDDTNGLSHYSWTATANCTVTVSFSYSNDDDGNSSRRARILRNSTPVDIGPGASPTPTQSPPPEPSTDYMSGVTTGTLTLTAGQVLTFAATGPEFTQYFDNVSVSAV